MENQAVESPKLETVLDNLFSGDPQTTYTIQSGNKKGTVVHFHTAKWKQVAGITRLLNELVQRVPKDKFAALIGAIAKMQMEVMTSGQNKDQIELATTNLVKSFLGDTYEIVNFVASCMDIAPRIAGVLCDLKQEDIDNLELDDAAMVIIGMVSVNYDFFTRKFLPLCKAAFAGYRRNESALVGKMVQVAPVPTSVG